MGKAGIKVIMGTPTYSVPTWMAKAHPEILVRPLGAPLKGGETTYGIRQNMDTDNPTYRRYAQRVIANMVAHYKNNPDVIGWQIDNETGSYGAFNDDVFTGFVDHLKKKFVTTDALNKAWFLNYWGQDVNNWNDMPTRDHATSTELQARMVALEPDARDRLPQLAGRASAPELAVLTSSSPPTTAA